MTDLAPTLGPQVAHFINTNGVHGPGDLIGQRFELGFEELAFLYRVYELGEDEFRPGRWRRRFRRGVYCRRKGKRKTEFMAQVALAEFDGPVRFSGRWAEGGEVDEWGYRFEAGEPIGDRVTSPEIPVVATTEDQAEKLVWGVMRYVFQHTPLASRYKVQEDQIFFAGQQKEAGWCYLIPPTNPDAADGARPTFIPREEAHRWTSAKLRQTADVMDNNAVKRQAADPWTMDATTIHAPGEGSVLESSLQALRSGDESILFDLLAASTDHDLDDDDQWVEAVREASGDAWPWTNVAGLRAIWLDPTKSRAEFCRFHLNQGVAIENRPFSGDMFDLFADPRRTPGPSRDTPIVVVLTGSVSRESTAVVGWTVEDRPHLFLAGLWERPDAGLRDQWSVPKAEVVRTVDDLLEGFTVVSLAGFQDQTWSSDLVGWEDRIGSDRVFHLPSRRSKVMSTAVKRFEDEWAAGVARASTGGSTPWTHDGSPDLRRHLAAAVVERSGTPDETGQGSTRVLAKASDGAADMIDGAVGAVAGFALIPDAAVRAAALQPTEAGIY